jgi:hypothetical protein
MTAEDKTPSGQKGKYLDYYWKGVVKNLNRELELYKLLQDVESVREDETGPGRSNSTSVTAATLCHK